MEIDGSGTEAGGRKYLTESSDRTGTIRDGSVDAFRSGGAIGRRRKNWREAVERREAPAQLLAPSLNCSWSGKEGESPEMADSRPLVGEGQRLSHLRSIGSRAPVPGISQVIHFSKAVTLFGRNSQVVDHCLNSPAAAATADLNYISRVHARIILTDGEYVLVDSSLTGVYVNDVRIKGRVNLREGDTVTFGHPAGKNLLPGSAARQPNSPFYFLFEHCDCCPDRMQRAHGDGGNSPQPLKPPDLASAGVSPSGNLNLAFAPNVSRPQMTPPGLLPVRAPLASSAPQCDPQAALAPPLSPALPLPPPPQDAAEQSRVPPSPRPPSSASHARPSASPDYPLPEGDPLAAPGSPPLQGNPGSGDSVPLSRHSRRENAPERDRPPPPGWAQRQDAGRGPERGCVGPPLPASPCPEVWEAGDQDGSPKATGASGPWEETLPLSPGSAPSVFGPESPALSETDQDEEEAEMDLWPNMEETACVGEPGSPAEEMQGVGLAGSRAQVSGGSMDECQENLVEKHPPKGPSEGGGGVEGRAVGLSSEIQAPESGHVGIPDSGKRTAEVSFSSGEEPTDEPSTKIFRQEKLDSGRRNALSPSRNSSPGTQSGAVGNPVDSPEKVAASEDAEMGPPTEDGLEGVGGHLRGGEPEPEMTSAIPADAEGACGKAGVVDLRAEMGIWADGGKPGEMEAAAAESLRDVEPKQRPDAEAKQRLLQKFSGALVLDQPFEGRFSQGGKPKDWSEASGTTGENSHSPEACEGGGGGGRAVRADWLQARPPVREEVVLARALGNPLPEPPENLGEVTSEQGLFCRRKILFGNPGGGRSVGEEELERETPIRAESSSNWKEQRPGLQDAEETGKNVDSSLGIVDVPVVRSSGGGEPPSDRRGGGRERQGGSQDPPSEDESEGKRSIIGTLAAANEDAANQPREAEGGLDKGPRGLAEQEKAAVDASLARSPSPDPAERPSSLGGSSRKGLQEGGIPHLADLSLAGTQLPSPQSRGEAGESLGSDRLHLLGCQEDERLTSLDGEGRGKTTVGGEEEEEPSIPLAVTRRDFDPCPMQTGALKGPRSAFSSCSSSAVNQLQWPIEADPQEPKSDIVEPENLENCLEVKSQGGDVGGKLPYLEDPLGPGGGSEEPEAPLEQISLPVPREPGQGVLIPEGSGWPGHVAENPHCRKARGSPGLPLPSLGALQPGKVAVHLPVEPMDGSAEALPWLEGEDGLQGQIPASEAEKEERGQLGPSKADGLLRRRDPSCFRPAEQRADATESREALREPAEELAIQEAGTLKGPEMLEMSLEGQTSSRRDQGCPVRPASSPAATESGGASRSRKGWKRAAEAPEEPGGGPDPDNLAGQPANSPSKPASQSAGDGRAACKDQGFMENARQDLDRETLPMAGRPPGQLDRAAVASPLGGAVQELLGSQSSSSLRSGEGQYAQKAGLALKDVDGPAGQESACHLGNVPEASAGDGGGFGGSEPCEALLQEEENPSSPPPQKRLRPEDLGGAACDPKKLCREDPARGPAASPPPPPPLKGSLQPFGQTMETFLDQWRSRVPPCSEPTQGKGEAIARMVRSYFQSNIEPNQPAAERGEGGALPSGGAAAKAIGGRSEGGTGDPGDGPGSAEGEEEGARPLADAPVSPGGRSAGSGSSAREEGKGPVGPGQEDACSLEEEPLPVEVGSALGDSEWPKAEPPEGPLEEEPGSAGSQGYEPPASLGGSHSDPALDGASGGSGSPSEMDWNPASDGDWDAEGTETPPRAAMPWQEDSRAAPGDTWPESVRPLGPSEQEAPGRWLPRGEADGGDGPDGSACREDPGEAPEEKAAEGQRREMPAEGSPPGQEKRGSPTRDPFPQAPWESSPQTPLHPAGAPWDPPMKTEEMTDEDSDGRGCRRKEPPLPEGRPPGASGSPEEGPATPGAPLLRAKEEPVQEEESSLCAAGPSRAVGRGSPGKEDLGWPEGGPGQAASHQASWEAPWIPGTSEPCRDGGPGGAWPLQGDGSPLAQSPLAGAGLRPQAPQEEKWRLWTLPSRPPPPPPPSPSLSRHSPVPTTSADEQPEGPWPRLASSGSRAPVLPCPSEEAGPTEPSDAECLRVAAAVSGSAPPEAQERAPLFRDPPAWMEPHGRCPRGRAETGRPAEWASSEQEVAFQLQECQAVLAGTLQALSLVEGVDKAHLEKWRDQIAALQKATKMPQTHIALVGNTGAGKSCLLNALLDEEAMLPTSAMRACTAVVVEISRAAEGSPYEAEVEFLSWEEWNKELGALLEDMKDKAGNLKKRCPDRKTEAGAAYSRVKAVYGRVDELEKLEDKQGVTQHLGTVKRICAETAADFRVEIEKFIDSRTDHLREMKGGEFWPIVKCVRIRVAKAEVLRTGAVLVDLPGTRDSNAGRDTTAQEYLKDCHAVWVTASITRAVDDKTAKELLSANFRRQLFMDGLYGRLAFVCTKTDSFSISDIVRDLNLQDKIRPLEEELQELERQRTQAEMGKKHLYAQLQQQQQEPTRKGRAEGDSAWLQRHDFLEKEFTICALQREKEARLRAISLICVQARNAFSKQRILRDFSAGLQEVSRRAEGEEDGEEEMDEGDSAAEQPANLEVFTVSSTEYLKLGGKLLCNGQPQVFHDVKDTEIPALKKFAMDTALKHSMVATEQVIRDIARVLSQVVNYLNSQRTQADARHAQVKEMLQQALQGLPALLQGVLTASSQDLRHAFEALILGSLQNGAENAKRRSEAIVKGWGSPVLGYPHVTYRAICNHRGVYTSPRYQSVDFNKELAGPILKVVSVAWNEVFGSKVLSCLEAFGAALLHQLGSFFRGLERKLPPDGPVAKALHAIHAQQMEAARARLFNFTLDQMTSITRRQRTVSRLLIPTIQAGMEPAYSACSQLSGQGYFRRMKEEMETFIQQQKEAIFHAAVEKMRQQLELLQGSIRCSLQSVAQELATSIRMQFEPLLRPVQKDKEILPELQRLCAKVDKICQRSGVDYLLPTARQPEEPPPATEAEEPGSGGCVRVGALPLPHRAALEQSLERAEPPEPTVALGTAGQPPQGPLLLPWPPHGRKRAGEAVLPQLEKKTRLHSVGPAGSPRLPCSQRAETKPPSCTTAFLGSCSPEGASRPDGPPCPAAESPGGEPLAVSCSAGLLWVGARKPPSASVKEEEALL